MTFSEKLREIKEARGMSYGDLAAATGVCKNSLAMHINSGKVPGVVRRRSMALGLGLDEDYFIIGVDVPQQQSAPRVKKTKKPQTVPVEQYEREVRRRKNAEALANEYYRRLVRRGLY